MLKLIHFLLLIWYFVCSVKFTFGLKVNDTGVCLVKVKNENTKEVTCCQGYRLHSDGEACIDCPNGTYGDNCVYECTENHYGLRCHFECNCPSNETCNKVTGCEESKKLNYESSITTANVITSVTIVTVVAVLCVTAFVVSWKSCNTLKKVNPLKGLFHRTQPVFVQSRHKTRDIDIEDDDPYSEIRESMMVRPMTVYGRKLSIRSSYIDPDDQYHRIELATSLRRPNLDRPTIEYTDYTEPIDEPLLQPKNNIYEQLIIDESTETQRNSDNAIYAEVVENQNNACSPQKHLNTTERSDKCNLVTEADYTDDKGDNCTERETTVYSMQMPLNTSEISNKTDVVIDIQDNTTYAKVVKNSNNECSSKIHINTTGIPDKSNFVTGTNSNEEISKNSTKSKVHTADSKGEMTTESESERKISSLQCEEENSNKNIVLNKIMSDYEDTPVMISVSVGKQTIFIDLKDRNVLNSLSNDGILENAITSVQMTTNVNKE